MWWTDFVHQPSVTVDRCLFQSTRRVGFALVSARRSAFIPAQRSAFVSAGWFASVSKGCFAREVWSRIGRILCLQRLLLVVRVFAARLLTVGVCGPVCVAGLGFVLAITRGDREEGEGCAHPRPEICAAHQPGEWDVVVLVCRLHVHMHLRWRWPGVGLL